MDSSSGFLATAQSCVPHEAVAIKANKPLQQAFGWQSCLLNPAFVWHPLSPVPANAQLDDVMGQAQSVAGSLTGQRRLFSNIGSKLADVTARFPVVNNLLTSIRRRKNRVSTFNVAPPLGMVAFLWHIDTGAPSRAATGPAHSLEHWKTGEGAPSRVCIRAGRMNNKKLSYLSCLPSAGSRLANCTWPHDAHRCWHSAHVAACTPATSPLVGCIIGHLRVLQAARLIKSASEMPVHRLFAHAQAEGNAAPALPHPS